MKIRDGFGLAFWACAGITLFNALAGASYSLLSLRMAGGHESALYAASRSVALVLAVLIAMILRSRRGMTTIAAAITLVEAFDGVVGFLVHVPGRTYGPAFFAALNFGALIWMNRTASDHSG